MDLTLKIMKWYCATDTFSINGILADENDFGEKSDTGYDDMGTYCSNMQFEGKEPSLEILAKYSISESEYHQIVSKLEEGLSFGCCNACE